MSIFGIMAVSGIYKIESKIKPERCYIGSAVNINRRWNVHLRALKGISAYLMTDVTKQKLSKVFKGKPLSEDTKQKLREGWELRRLRLNKPRSKYLIKKYGT